MRRRSFLALSSLSILAACKAAAGSSGSSRDSVPWPASRVVTSTELAKAVGGAPATRPRVIHVGPERLFHSAHVPGAVHAGEGGDDDGLAAFAAMLGPLPRDADVVVYCGCCPYANCPNVRPAYAKMVALGFTRGRVLDLPTNLKTDWTDLGFPVERG
jgi:hypothetical protein